ncbi:MAG TPA: D-2-hydroxyacid dehydrogenase [Bacillota bacterium]
MVSPSPGPDDRWQVLIYHPEADVYRDAVEQQLAAEPTLAARVALTTARSRDEAAARIADADALLTSGLLEASYLRRARRLRWIQTTSAGVEGLLRPGVLPAGVRLARLTGSFGPRMAEYVAAYMLAATQRLPAVLAQQSQRLWRPFEPGVLAGRLAGVAGLGSIGRAVVAKLVALGLRVRGCSRTRPRDLPLEAWFDPEQRAAFVSGCDFVVLCLPETPQTRDFMGPAELTAMKPDAWLINIGRGSALDEEALVAALRAGRLGGAVLDVFRQEPLAPDSPLWDAPNLIITPHISGVTLPDEAASAFLANFRRLLAGEPLLDEVDPARGY